MRQALDSVLLTAKQCPEDSSGLQLSLLRPQPGISLSPVIGTQATLPRKETLPTGCPSIPALEQA